MDKQEWLNEAKIVNGKLRVVVNSKYPQPFFYTIAKQITPAPGKGEMGMTITQGGKYKDELYWLARNNLKPSEVLISTKNEYSTVHIAGKKQKFATAFIDANPQGEVIVYEDESCSEVNTQQFTI